MTRNLSFKGTSLSSTTSNIAAIYTDENPLTISYDSLAGGSSLNDARIYDSGDTNTGVWYNYAAASAMSIIGSSSTSAQVYDLCPKGWKLPNIAEYRSIIDHATEFSPVTGGEWASGTLYYPQYGYWWISEAYNATYRYYIDADTKFYNIFHDGYRGNGFFIRCILSS